MVFKVFLGKLLNNSLVADWDSLTDKLAKNYFLDFIKVKIVNLGFRKYSKQPRLCCVVESQTHNIYKYI